MRRNFVGAAHETMAAIGREYDDGRQRRLERARQIRKALEIEHVHFVDEQHAWHEFGNALFDVLIDNLNDVDSDDKVNSVREREREREREQELYHTNLVHFLSQFVRDFRLAPPHQLIHHRRYIVATFGRCVRAVEVVQRHVLHLFVLRVFTIYFFASACGRTHAR